MQNSQHSDYYKQMGEANNLVDSHPLFATYAFIMSSNSSLFKIGKKFLIDFNFSELLSSAQDLDNDSHILFRYAVTFISPSFYDLPFQDMGIVDSFNLSHDGRLILLGALKFYFIACDAMDVLNDKTKTTTRGSRNETTLS